MVRKLTLAALAAFTLGIVGLGFSSADAAPLTPSGLCGATNMVNDAARPHMLEAMAEHTADQGDAGMFAAVALTACD
jgi:hypothetical protein